MPAYARVPVLSAAAALAVVLLATAGRYGFHRDELYFRMLDPSWGYVDQPPLIPLIANAMADLVADEPWALRLPAIAAVVGSTLVVAAITRDLGGGALAQGLCAWTFAFATFPLVAGHVLGQERMHEAAPAGDGAARYLGLRPRSRPPGGGLGPGRVGERRHARRSRR